jgi:hypothetical protein
VFFRRVVRGSRFPRAKTNRSFDPEQGAANNGIMSSGIFGEVAVADYVKVQEAHAHHHRRTPAL